MTEQYYAIGSNLKVKKTYSSPEYVVVKSICALIQVFQHIFSLQAVSHLAIMVLRLQKIYISIEHLILDMLFTEITLN